MKFLLDADILSMFAKVAKIELLEEILGRDNVAITPGVLGEVTLPLRFGYSFPEAIIQHVTVVSLLPEDIEELLGLQSKYPSLGRGELESIAVCKTKGYTFASNDRIAKASAEKEGVKTLSLQALLRAMWEKRGRSKEEVKQILEAIKISDKLEIPSEVENEIFG